MVETTQRHRAEHVPLPDLNKAAIAHVRARVLSAQPPPDPIEAQSPTASDPTNDAFMERLQTLELQRNAPTPLAPPVAPPPTVPSAPTPILTPTTPAPAPAATPTPAPPSLLRSIVTTILGIERAWDYFHSRSTFSWAGPRPESSMISLSCIMLPSMVSKRSPVVEVYIEGAGRQTATILCVCHTKSTGSAWDVWRPPSISSAVFPCFATPWTVHLRDPHTGGSPLDMGCDGALIAEATPIAGGDSQFTSWEFATHDSPENVAAGSTLLCKSTTGDVTRHSVVRCVGNNAVVVKGNHVDKKGGICAVVEMQAVLLLETDASSATQRLSLHGNQHGHEPPH